VRRWPLASPAAAAIIQANPSSLAKRLEECRMRRALSLLALAVLLAWSAQPAAAQKAVLVAGGAKEPPAPAAEAKLNTPFGVDFDKAGRMFLVELNGQHVHMVDAKGLLTTIAGTGKKGDAGDGGPAAQAEFNGMHSLVVLPDGNLCLADTWNSRLRKLDVKTGTITALAGTGKKGFSGDGGPALKADFGNLYCVALDPRGENLYVADLDNKRIRKIELATGTVTTVAGNGQKGVPKDGAVAAQSPLVDPRAVAVDKKGNVWILERSGHALRVVDSQGMIRTVAGTGKAGLSGDGGPALKAQLNGPKHLCIDLDGNVIIADTANHVIRKYLVAEGKIVRVAGSGKKGSAGVGGDPLKLEMNEPHGVYVHPSGTLYIVDSNNHRVLKVVEGGGWRVEGGGWRVEGGGW
jgi:DNA-binding beta-propeller fold protein YncE